MSEQTRCVLYIAMSLDGYIAESNGDVKWLEEAKGDGGDNGYSEFYNTVDALIMGRKTYEQVLTFGDWMYSGKPCYVFSRTRKGKDEYAEFIDTDAVGFMERIRQQPDIRSIWLVGGAEIIDPFLRNNQIDEYIVTIIPVILGKGIPMFYPDTPKIRLTLIEKKQMGDMVQVRYVPEELPLG